MLRECSPDNNILQTPQPFTRAARDRPRRWASRGEELRQQILSHLSVIVWGRQACKALRYGARLTIDSFLSRQPSGSFPFPAALEPREALYLSLISIFLIFCAARRRFIFLRAPPTCSPLFSPRRPCALPHLPNNIARYIFLYFLFNCCFWSQGCPLSSSIISTAFPSFLFLCI